MCIRDRIWRTLGNKRRKENQIKFYKTMAIPTLLCSSETWVMKKKDALNRKALTQMCIRDSVYVAKQRCNKTLVLLIYLIQCSVSKT